MNIFGLLVLVSVLASSVTLSMTADSGKSTRKTYISGTNSGPILKTTWWHNRLKNGHTTYPKHRLQNLYSTNSAKQQQRNRRQSLKRQPGFFFLLNQFVFDTVNDTGIAYRNISRIFNDLFTTTPPSPTQADGNATTPAPPLTMQQLFDVLGRNYKGLARLFNREWNTALRDSNRNIAQFRRDFKESLRPFFEPNPNITNRIT